MPVTGTPVSSGGDDAAWAAERARVAWETTVEPITGVSVETAAAASESDYADKAKPKFWIAWDLYLQIFAAVIPGGAGYSKETLDGWSFDVGIKVSEQAKHYWDLAKYFKSEADASEVEDAGAINSFQMVTGVYGRQCSSDENSR